MPELDLEIRAEPRHVHEPVERLGVLGEELIKARDLGVLDRPLAERAHEGVELFQVVHAFSAFILFLTHSSRRSWIRSSAL